MLIKRVADDAFGKYSKDAEDGVPYRMDEYGLLFLGLYSFDWHHAIIT